MPQSLIIIMKAPIFGVWDLGLRGLAGQGFRILGARAHHRRFFIQSGSAVDDINPALPIIRNIPQFP